MPGFMFHWYLKGKGGRGCGVEGEGRAVISLFISLFSNPTNNIIVVS
jgi:hypothetical protein